MTAASAVLLTYSAQVLILIAAAALAALAVGLSLPTARLHYWRAVVALCLLLPAVPDLRPSGQGATVTFELAAGGAAPGASAGGSWASPLAAALLAIVAAGIVARLLWLALGAVRLRQLRQRSRPASLAPDLAELRDAVAPRAVVHVTADVTQPVTFGWRRPLVLLPPRFETLEPDARRTVLCHELLHVRRRDWPGIVGEEVLRAVFWFHPAMWWALDQLHLGREQVVDQLVMARTPARRAYMDALLQFADAPDAARPAIAFLRRRHLTSRLRQLAKEPHMTRVRLASAFAVLLVVVTGTAAAVLSALPLDLPALQSATALEVRLAESSPAAGLVEAVVQGTDRKVYLQPGSIVTSADVTSAQVIDAGGGRYSVGVGFSATASIRLAESTKIHLGRPVAILLNGRVIAAPVVRSMIRDSAVISGDFSKDEAERIAAGFGRTGAAAARPGQERVKGGDPGVVLPVAQFKPRPQYTQAAMDAKVQGVVELSAVVRADGTVGEVAVTQSLDTSYGLDDAAVAAVQQWTFTPGTKDGRAVDVEIHLMIRFTLA